MKRTYIIAEAGVNHNGSLPMAMQLIEAASNAGADAVKFQTFKASNLVTEDAPKAGYQKTNTAETESQYDMLKKLELSLQDHIELIKHCQLKKIDFISTPFDLESVDLLTTTLKLNLIKLPSGEITNAPLLLKAAQSGASLIVSTGMSTLGEVETALGILAFGYLKHTQAPSIEAFQMAYASEAGQNILREKVSLLHCTSEYPAPFGDVNLRAMDTLRSSFLLSTGLSDHTVGIAIPIAAAARGASIIEKHFTLDRMLPGPDHIASLEPLELQQMITSIRQVEVALGVPQKRSTPSEMGTRLIARKSIVAAKTILKGEIFTQENLTTKRPGDGISPLYLWEYTGKTALKDYKADEKVEL